MSVQKRIERNLLGDAGDLLTSTWPPQWARRTVGDDSGADLIYVSSADIQRRFVQLYGEVEAAIEFALPVDLDLTAEAGYQVRFLYQPTQRASDNPKVRVYFNARAHFWERELQTSTVREGVEQPRDWLTCEDTIVLNDENLQPKAALAFQSGLFDPSSADVDVTTGPENDQPIAQEPGWPGGPGELHFSGKALGTGVPSELAVGVSISVHLRPLQLTTDQPMPELDGVSARYWVEKDGRTYMPICRGGGGHHLTLPVTEACGWAGGGIYHGTSAYASFTDPNEAGQARLQVTATDPDADDEAQHIAKVWDIRNDADANDGSVDGMTAILRFESVYHAPPHETLACIVGPYKLDIVRHKLPEFWPSVAEDETISPQLKVRYTVSDKGEPDIAVEWRHDGSLLDTKYTQADGWATFVYQPTADAQLIASIDSPYKAEADTHVHAFDIKTIPTAKWAQFELSVDGEEISPDDPWRILPGHSYELTLKPRSDSVMTGEDLTLTVDESRLQVEPTEARPLVEEGLTWTVTTSSDDIGDFTLSLDCIRFKQSPTWMGTTNRLPALTIAEADGSQLDPLAAVANLTAVVPQYDDMRGTDKISVTWTGAADSPEEGSHSTTPVEVGTVGPKPIELPVALIPYALDKSVTVTYTVTRGETSLPAPDSLTLNVSALPESALMPSKPRIIEADQSDELDIGSLSGDVTVRTDSWPHIAHGQRTWLRLEGRNADSSTYDKQLARGDRHWVTLDWYNRGFGEFIIPYSELQRLSDGSQLKLEFKASFNQSLDEDQATPFPLRTYTIRAAFDARAPSVEQATGNAPSQQLNPMDVEDKLTVVIPDYGIQPGDQVSVTWTGAAGTAEGGSHTTDVQALPSNREIEMPVSVIAFNLGTSVTVSYTVTRNSGTKPPSAALTLAVGVLSQGDLDPSKPRIIEADQSGELDIGSLSGDITVRTGIWPHIAVDQYLWLRLKGSKADGTAHNLNIWAPPSSKVNDRWLADEFYDKLVSDSYSYLQELGDGSELTVEFKVAFGQSTDETQSIAFPLRTYTIRAAFDARAPSVEQATGNAPSQQLNPMDVEDKLTVVIPDYGIQPGDQVSVTWTGAAGTAEGGSHTTDVQALPSTRKIEVPKSVIAYNLGKPVTVTYTVTRNSGTKPPSATLTLAVGVLSQSDLEPGRPRILQAADSGNGDELNMESVSGDITVRTGIWPHIAVDQYLWLRLKGSKADGTAHNLNIWAPPSSKVNDRWLADESYDKLVSDSYSYLQELGGGSTLTVEFKVAFGQSTDETQSIAFPLRTYSIREAFDAPAPTVEQALGDTPNQQLEPTAITDKLTVVIPDYGIRPGDQVSVTWAGTAGAGSHITAKQSLPVDRKITIPVRVVAYNLDKSVTVTYTVTRTTGVKPPSAALTLNVRPIEPYLAKPRIPQVTFDASSQTQVLDLKKFTGNAQVIVQPWPLIALNQRVWLRCEADTITSWLSQGSPVSSSEVSGGLYKEIPRTLLESMRHDRLLTVGLQVTFDHSSDRERAVNFPLRSHIVKKT